MISPQSCFGLVIARLWDGALARPDEVIVVRVAPDAGGLRVVAIAPAHGDPAPSAPPGPTDRLWEHEVVELFIASAQDRERYTEVELGPHGHHLVLTLQGVRRPTADRLPLKYAAQRSGGFWRGEAWIAPAQLPPGPWVFNATAIHGQGTDRRYLSWRPLPGPQPDFHQPERFAPIGGLGEFNPGD